MVEHNDLPIRPLSETLQEVRAFFDPAKNHGISATNPRVTALTDYLNLLNAQQDLAALHQDILTGQVTFNSPAEEIVLGSQLRVAEGVVVSSQRTINESEGRGLRRTHQAITDFHRQLQDGYEHEPEQDPFDVWVIDTFSNVLEEAIADKDEFLADQHGQY